MYDIGEPITIDCYCTLREIFKFSVSAEEEKNIFSRSKEKITSEDLERLGKLEDCFIKKIRLGEIHTYEKMSDMLMFRSFKHEWITRYIYPSMYENLGIEENILYVFRIPYVNSEKRPVFFDANEIINHIFFSNNSRIKQLWAKNKTIITDTLLTGKNVLIDSITLAAWKQAIVEYEKKPRKRKNDALFKRMSLYLRSKSGTHFSDLEKESANLSRDLKVARENDVPKLKKLFPTLPSI